MSFAMLPEWVQVILGVLVLPGFIATIWWFLPDAVEDLD